MASAASTGGSISAPTMWAHDCWNRWLLVGLGWPLLFIFPADFLMSPVFKTLHYLLPGCLCECSTSLSVCFPCRSSPACTVSVVSRWLSLIPFQHLQSVTNWDRHRAEISVYCLHTGLLVWPRLLWGLDGCFLPPVFQCLTQTCMKLAFSCTPVFSLFLTPMFVLLQDSVPMASPAFLLSLFVSIQGLPPISPEPGNAPYTLVSTQTHMRHTL